MAAVKEIVETIIDSRHGMPSQVIEVLQDVQQARGHLCETAMATVSERLGVPLIDVYRVASFYKAFSLKPRGRHLIVLCTGTACHVRGAGRVLDEAAAQLKIEPGDTTDDGAFTVETVNCLGACALGPVVVVDGRYHAHMTPGKLRKLIQAVRQEENEIAAHA